MIDKETIYATLIDFVGIILMFTSVIFLPKIFMVIFPLICYIITNRYFKEKFWKAFGISIVLMIILVVIGIYLIVNTSLGSTFMEMIYGI